MVQPMCPSRSAATMFCAGIPARCPTVWALRKRLGFGHFEESQVHRARVMRNPVHDIDMCSHIDDRPERSLAYRQRFRIPP